MIKSFSKAHQIEKLKVNFSLNFYPRDALNFLEYDQEICSKMVIYVFSLWKMISITTTSNFLLFLLLEKSYFFLVF